MAFEPVVRIKARVNWRRFQALRQEAVAKIRRARRNDRPAMHDRYQRRMLAECLRVEVET